MANGRAATRTGDGPGTTSDHVTTDYLADKAHETVNRMAKGTAEAETKIREKAEVAADRLRDTEKRAKEAVERSTEGVTDYIRENPLMSAGVAFVAGVFLSGLLRR